MLTSTRALAVVVVRCIIIVSSQLTASFFVC